MPQQSVFAGIYADELPVFPGISISRRAADDPSNDRAARVSHLGSNSSKVVHPNEEVFTIFNAACQTDRISPKFFMKNFPFSLFSISRRAADDPCNERAARRAGRESLQKFPSILPWLKVPRGQLPAFSGRKTLILTGFCRYGDITVIYGRYRTVIFIKS
jgi:hypothetical protein